MNAKNIPKLLKHLKNRDIRKLIPNGNMAKSKFRILFFGLTSGSNRNCLFTDLLSDCCFSAVIPEQMGFLFDGRCILCITGPFPGGTCHISRFPENKIWPFYPDDCSDTGRLLCAVLLVLGFQLLPDRNQ